VVEPGIHAYVGPNGSGKSLFMMEDLVLPSLAAGRPVLSAFRIFASAEDADMPRERWDERKPHELWIPFTKSLQVLSATRCTMLLDEITTAYGSREASKLPFQVAARLQQLRKPDVIVGWSGPSWKRADIILRECTSWVTLCRGFRPERVEGRRRGANRLFRYRTYDAQTFEEFNLASALDTKKGTLRPKTTRWYRRQAHDTHMLYDTFETVPTLDHHEGHGTCVICGGRRAQPKCDGHDLDQAGGVESVHSLMGGG